MAKQKAKVVKLNLTMEQAYILREVLWNVGGDPDGGPRGEMDAVLDKMIKYHKDFRKVKLELGVVGQIDLCYLQDWA